MDEIIFRSSQKVEDLQVQLALATTQAKNSLRVYSEQIKMWASDAWNSAQSAQFRVHMKHFSQVLISKSQECQYKLSYYAQVFSPKKLFSNLIATLSKPWTKRDIYFLCVGFVCGGLVGITIGLVIKKKEPILRYMQAIQCTHYMGSESAVVIENAIAPHECGPDDVLINVKAASIQVIDAKICSGYGRNLRKILHHIYHQSTAIMLVAILLALSQTAFNLHVLLLFKQSRSDLPVTLGRDCTGIITDIGTNVKRLEVGDEVWLAVPFWHQGTLSQSVLVSERRVGRKPKMIGFEGACSLPYAGSLALSALQQASVTSANAPHKRVLVHGGCTPVGCILLQVLSHWGADVTTTCYRRAVPVAKALGGGYVIQLTDNSHSVDNKSALNIENTNDVLDMLPKELALRDKFDVIILTRECSLSKEELMQYTNQGHASIVTTMPSQLASDGFGLFMTFVYGGFIRLKYLLEKMLSISVNEFDEAHMCYVLLDEMAEMVEHGNLQTVVDKVYHPQDIELALSHIQSPISIGSTIITFR